VADAVTEGQRTVCDRAVRDKLLIICFLLGT